jgi:2-succinyl-5-enolpyruvyl-6-hydroxy-3-cyclohexene-1-carboxylate synthase
MWQISNIRHIRYAQLIDIHPTIEVYCNRGTSGIDGKSLDLAGGCSHVKQQVISVFLYDSNAIWNN